MSVKKVGRYEILEVIGHGGQSIAYKARDPKIDRIVAIKQIRSRLDVPEKVRNEFKARFMREAQAAGRLLHPNIAVIYDVGGDEEGDPYIAMEFIDGTNLYDLLSSGQRLPQEQVLRIFPQLCSALQYAHESGIVHRDIKPANIMITRDGQVKVVDFGIAKLSSSTITQTGVIMGTPSYMSPEQIMGKSVDHRSDIFSIGVVLYETLTGERPFTGKNPTTIIFKIVHDPHPRILAREPGLLLDFDPILDRALAKNPDQRYQSCAELDKDLKRLQPVQMPGTASGILSSPTSTAAAATTAVIQGPGAEQGAATGTTRAATPEPGATVAGKASAVAGVTPPAPESIPAEEAPPKGMTVKTLGIAAAAAVVLIGLALFLWLRGGSTPPPSETSLPVRTTVSPSQVPQLLSDAKTAMAEGLLTGNDKKNALYFVNAILAADPAHVEAARLKTDIRARTAQQADDAAQKGKLEEAVAAYDALLKYFSGDAELQSKRNAAQAKLARTRMAAELENFRRDGEKAYRSGNYAQAIQQYGSLLQADPQNAAAAYYLGLSYDAQKILDKAIENLGRACALEPKNPTYTIQLALVQEKSRNFSAAAKLFEKAGQLGGNHEYNVAALKTRAYLLNVRMNLAGLTPYNTACKHDHAIGGCDGELTITNAGFQFVPSKQKDHAVQAGFATVRFFAVNKSRLAVILASGRRYSYDLPDPAPVSKIADAFSKVR